MFVIIIVNVFGIFGYVEEEFWFLVFKFGVIVVFMIIVVVFVCGGGFEGSVYDEYFGGKFW